MWDTAKIAEIINTYTAVGVQNEVHKQWKLLVASAVVCLPYLNSPNSTIVENVNADNGLIQF